MYKKKYDALYNGIFEFHTEIQTTFKEGNIIFRFSTGCLDFSLFLNTNFSPFSDETPLKNAPTFLQHWGKIVFKIEFIEIIEYNTDMLKNLRVAELVCELLEFISLEPIIIPEDVVVARSGGSLDT